MADYGTFQWGAVQYPLTSSTSRSALEDADPALFEATGFFEGVLAIHLGARWDAEVTAIGLPELAGSIVASTSPYDPVPVFQQAQFQFPLLALYRIDGSFGARTVDRAHEVSRWGLDWVLPPLTPAQLERLYPFLHSASRVLNDRTDYGYDPDYEAGRKVWDIGGVERIGFVKHQFTWLQNRGPGMTGAAAALNTAFPCLHMELEVAERRMLSGDPTPGNTSTPLALFTPFDGSDVTVKSTDATDPTGGVDIASFKENP